MNIKQLKSLIVQGESETLEFKTSTSQLKPACETLCGYLNALGGTVLIGIRNNGEIIGQDVTDNTRQEIANELRKMEPTPQITVQYIKVGDKQVVVMQAPAGKHAPYVYDGRPFERTQSSKGRMTQHRYEQLLVERGQLNHSWEMAIAENYTIDDLDHEEIRLAVKQGIAVGRVPLLAENESIQSILKSWDLLDGEMLNNAAVVLFAKKTLPFYTQCHIKLGRFRGTDMLGNFIDNKEFFGNAFRLFAEANTFIMRHLPIASFFETDNLERIDKPALPVLAVREALVNAICHRDYSNCSSSISVAIFDDRMEIWNNGKLPSDLKIEDFKKKHKSEPPNKKIAKVFYDRKYFDGWGTGILKIFNLCHENDVPAPKYEKYSGGIEITFKFKEPIGKTGAIKEITLSLKQKEILEIIKKYDSVNIQQIMEELVNPPSQRMLQKYLKQLKQQDLIELQQTGRNALWALKPTSK